MGLQLLATKGMNSFRNRIQKLISNSKSARIVGGFDPDADECNYG